MSPAAVTRVRASLRACGRAGKLRETCVGGCARMHSSVHVDKCLYMCMHMVCIWYAYGMHMVCIWYAYACKCVVYARLRICIHIYVYMYLFWHITYTYIQKNSKLCYFSRQTLFAPRPNPFWRKVGPPYRHCFETLVSLGVQCSCIAFEMWLELLFHHSREIARLARYMRD